VALVLTSGGLIAPLHITQHEEKKMDYKKTLMNIAAVAGAVASTMDDE